MIVWRESTIIDYHAPFDRGLIDCGKETIELERSAVFLQNWNVQIKNELNLSFFTRESKSFYFEKIYLQPHQKFLDLFCVCKGFITTSTFPYATLTSHQTTFNLGQAKA